jgi:hypothetical protein
VIPQRQEAWGTGNTFYHIINYWGLGIMPKIKPSEHRYGHCNNDVISNLNFELEALFNIVNNVK